MEDINNRFLMFYDRLKSEKKVKNAKDFAEKVGISPSFMTEIKKGRSNVGIEIIQNTVKKFDANAEWLLIEKGEMFKKDEISEQKTDATNENFLKFLHEENKVLNKKIWDLEAENKHLKDESSARKKTIDLDIDMETETEVG